jgi:hypothetical protein
LFLLSQGQCRLGLEKKQAVCSILATKIQQQIREFVGAAGFCQIWITNYCLLAKPLYEAMGVGGEQEPMVWGEEQKRPFKKLRGH